MGGSASIAPNLKGVVYQQTQVPESNSPKTNERPPQIKENLEEMEHELSFLKDNISILGDKISPILSPDTPQSENKAVDLGDPTCPIANVFYWATGILRHQNQIISSYLRRIEL